MSAILFLLLPGFSLSFDIEAQFGQAVFYSPEAGHYVESYVNIVGHSVKYMANENDVPQAKVEITGIVYRGDEIITFDKQVVKGPELIDSVALDFKHLFRFQLEPGLYKLEMVLQDLNKLDAKPFSYKKDIEVLYKSKGLKFSDIELLESISKTTEQNFLTKSGYMLVPLVDNFYPPEIEKIALYTEIYNSNKVIGIDEMFFLRTELIDLETQNVVTGYTSVQKLETNGVVPYIKVLPIENLPSGMYNLVLKIINRSNEIVAQNEVIIDRFNPISDGMTADDLAEVDIQKTFVNLIESEDSLDYYIAALRPITNDLEKRIMDKNLNSYDFETKKQFFYSFWQIRNPSDPEDEWNRYKVQLAEVEYLFGTALRPGFDTDRGRVYLRYGKPDYTESRPSEPSSYPYEMWQYYKIENFNNRRFIFYLPTQATNDYVLLHSDMRGEVQNFKWRRELEKRNTPYNNVDDENQGNQFGGRSGEVYERVK